MVVYFLVGDARGWVRGGVGAREDGDGVFVGAEGGAEDFGGDVWGGLGVVEVGLSWVEMEELGRRDWRGRRGRRTAGAACYCDFDHLA